MALTSANAIAIDAANTAWIASNGSLLAVTSAGTKTGTVTNSTISYPKGIAIDLRQRVCHQQDHHTLTEVLGAAAPTRTSPLHNLE